MSIRNALLSLLAAGTLGLAGGCLVIGKAPDVKVERSDRGDEVRTKTTTYEKNRTSHDGDGVEYRKTETYRRAD